MSSEYYESKNQPARNSFVAKIVSSFVVASKFKYNINFTEEKSNSTDDEIPKPSGTFAELLFTTKSGVGWVGSAAMPTGWALILVFIIILIFALPYFRKKGHFQVKKRKRKI